MYAAHLYILRVLAPVRPAARRREAEDGPTSPEPGSQPGAGRRLHLILRWLGAQAIGRGLRGSRVAPSVRNTG